MIDLNKIFRSGKTAIITILSIILSIVILVGVFAYIYKYMTQQEQEIVRHTNIPMTPVDKVEYSEDNKSKVVKGSDFLKKLKESDSYDSTKRARQVDANTVKATPVDTSDVNDTEGNTNKNVDDTDKQPVSNNDKDKVIPTATVTEDSNGSFIVTIGGNKYKVSQIEGLPKCSKESKLDKITIVKTIEPKQVSNTDTVWQTYNKLFEGEV